MAKTTRHDLAAQAWLRHRTPRNHVLVVTVDVQAFIEALGRTDFADGAVRRFYVTSIDGWRPFAAQIPSIAATIVVTDKDTLFEDIELRTLLRSAEVVEFYH